MEECKTLRCTADCGETAEATSCLTAGKTPTLEELPVEICKPDMAVVREHLVNTLSGIRRRWLCSARSKQTRDLSLLGHETGSRRRNSKNWVEGQDGYFNGSRRTEEQVGENGKARKRSSSPKWKIPLEWERFPVIKENGEKIAERWSWEETWILARS